MTYSIYNSENKEFNYYASYGIIFNGKGHYLVSLVVECENKFEKFGHTTTDTEFIDKYKAMQEEASYTECQNFIHEKFESEFAELVLQFCESAYEKNA